MGAASAVAIAGVFVWLGMVAAISFIEAPLKFCAPGITLALGLGIGRLVFRALNSCEAVLAVVIAAALFIDRPPAAAVIAFGCAAVALAAQLLAVRPALTRRSDTVLAAATADTDAPRSQAHYFYVGLELVKVVALLVTGILLLGG